MPSAIFAGVEMGGTKCVCIVGTGPNDIRAEEVLPTRDPAATLGAIAAELERLRASLGKLEPLGGPLGCATEVIGAALAEGRWGSARGLTDYAYIPVGTGVGVGLVVAG